MFLDKNTAITSAHTTMFSQPDKRQVIVSGGFDKILDPSIEFNYDKTILRMNSNNIEHTTYTVHVIGKRIQTTKEEFEKIHNAPPESYGASTYTELVEKKRQALLKNNVEPILKGIREKNSLQKENGRYYYIEGQDLLILKFSRSLENVKPVKLLSEKETPKAWENFIEKSKKEFYSFAFGFSNNQRINSIPFAYNKSMNRGNYVLEVGPTPVCQSIGFFKEHSFFLSRFMCEGSRDEIFDSKKSNKSLSNYPLFGMLGSGNSGGGLFMKLIGESGKKEDFCIGITSTCISSSLDNIFGEDAFEEKDLKKTLELYQKTLLPVYNTYESIVDFNPARFQN